MEFDPHDAVLENGYLEEGSPCAICGIGGIGKSRLALQMAMEIALGRRFLDWETNGEDLRWLFLQTENGNRRLKADLQPMMDLLTRQQRQIVDESITMHTLENHDDGFLSLGDQNVVAALQSTMTSFAPDIVLFDPLRDFAIGDLSSDVDMTATLSAILRIVRAGNPKRIPLILHHALTGKVGYAKAVGFERGGFGRNSKVLQGYMRSMINIAPEKSDSNETLIVASGKSNNSAEFQRIRRPPSSANDDLPPRRFYLTSKPGKERVGADFGSSGPRATIAHVVKIVGRAGLSGIPKKKLITALKNETGVSPATAYRLVDKAETQKAVIRRKNDEFYAAPE